MFRPQFETSTQAYQQLLGSYVALGYESRQSLPPPAYTSQAVLDLEVEQLLKREWLCIGRADEVPTPGDYFTHDLLGEPLLVVRGDDAAIRVLSNVCRHRGMLVADGHGHRDRFVCSYHAWTYGRDGALLRAPRMHGQSAFNADCRLPQFHHEIWQGFIYVNLDGEASSLSARLTGLETMLEPYGTAQMHHAFVVEEVWPVNWKCLFENFVEGYHLSVVHPVSLGGLTPTGLCEKFEGGDGYTGYRAHYPRSAPERAVHAPGLSERDRRCSTLFGVFPCHVASQSPDHLAYLALQPEGVDAVRLRWGIATYAESPAADEVLGLVEKWQTINAEDRAKLAHLQKSLRSQHAAPGPLAPADLEGTLLDFYCYLANRLATQV